MDEPPTSLDGSTTFGPYAATILATEHWSLLGTRSMAWNEAFTRTTIFLNALSASVVALALVADATGFDDSFTRFALFLFPIVFFLGVTTYARVVQINEEDIFLVLAMNRLRRGYLDLSPELDPYFTAGTHDDEAGLWATYLLGQMKNASPLLHFFVTTPTLLATLVAILAGAWVTLLASHYDVSGVLLVVICGLSVILVWFALFSLQWRAVREIRGIKGTRFPSPETTRGANSGSQEPL